MSESLDPDADQGFVLDGFPRNIAQAVALDNILDKLGKPIDAVLQFDVDADMLIQRTIGRLTCISCGALIQHHLHSHPLLMTSATNCGSVRYTTVQMTMKKSIERRSELFLKRLTQPLERLLQT